MLSWSFVLRSALILALLVSLAAPAEEAANALTKELVPGITYTREVRKVGGARAVIHSIVAPKPGGLYDLKPVLSNETIVGRERLTSMQKRLSNHATAAGINGDLFSFGTGHPSGMLLRDSVLESRPLGGRSTLGINVDGLLRIERITFFGSWQVAGQKKAPFIEFNRPLETKPNMVGLFTWRWGARTPKVKGAIDVVVTDLPSVVPNADLGGQILEIRRGGGTAIPQGGAVLQAIGFWADRLRDQSAPGLAITLHLMLKPWWEDVSDAIGGGPLLVKDGQPVPSAGEAFTSSQLHPRNPRTAVGQLADGRILLVAVDGRSGGSAGVRISQLARQLVRLGAVTAMALDAGGSTTMAFDGALLNQPSEGAERPLGDALMLWYYGAFAREARHPILSPNGDGVAEVQTLAYRVVRPSTVDVKLLAANDSIVWSASGLRDPGTYDVRPKTGLNQHGEYRWVVSAVDDEGQETSMTRTFTVNTTLGFLKTSKRRMKVRAKKGGNLISSFELANTARLNVRILDSTGKLVDRLLRAKNNQPDRYVLKWDGRDGRNRVVKSGRYTLRVTAANELGKVSLERAVTVKKIKKKRAKKDKSA